MSLDFRANQIRTNRLIASGSQIWVYGSSGDGTPPFAGNTSFGTGSIGTDTFLYVSGVYGSIGTANSYGATVFGGDVWVSGVFAAAGPGAFHQQVNHFGTDGWYAGFQVNAGDVRITENLFVSGSTQLSGTTLLYGPSYTYGTLSVQAGMSVFGSPVFYAGMTTYGNAKFNGGLSGSLQALHTGEPYILAGPNITVVTNSLGQVELSASIVPTVVPWSLAIAPSSSTTTDEIPTACAIYAVPLSYGTMVEFSVIGTKRDRSICSGWTLMTSVTNISGSLSQSTGSPIIQGPTNTNVTALGWGVTTDVSGAYLRLMVSGASSTTIDWCAGGKVIGSTG